MSALAGLAGTTDGAVVVRSDGRSAGPLAGGSLAAALAGARPVWWRAATAAAPLLTAGVRPAACWDLGAVHRLLAGGRRDDPGAVFSPGRDVPETAAAAGGPTLLDLAPDPDPVRPDGSLSPDWAAEPWTVRADDPGRRDPGRRDPGRHDAGRHDPGRPGSSRPERWAALALQVQARQAAALAALPDPRPRPDVTPLPLLTAYAESAAALLAVELEHDGLPVDRDTAQALLTAAIGPRPDDEQRARDERDRQVLGLAPTGARGTDLRAPLQVRALLARAGIDVPDTRSGRLEPYRSTSPLVDALLRWRRAERIATTYGWAWLDRHVGDDGRLRGSWSAADAAAGRMTASAGLHNLPADLRPAVAAEPGCLLVRADLGQVEPRVLAVVSGDPALAAAAREPDLYAPVAAQLGCDRSTAKVAVLAAMYGQTSGTAGAALQRMERAYPQALAHLRAAQAVGSDGGELRTWGGRLLRFAGGGSGRGARNAVVQGAAAELFKVWAATVRAGLQDRAVASGGSIVLCLHDELLLQVPQDRAPAAAQLLATALQEAAGRWAAGSGVRFVADVAVVRRWSDAKG